MGFVQYKGFSHARVTAGVVAAQILFFFLDGSSLDGVCVGHAEMSLCRQGRDTGTGWNQMGFWGRWRCQMVRV